MTSVLTLFCFQLLGRADNVKEYIRRGAEKAIVEVTLSSGDPNRPITVLRQMTYTEDKGGSSEWKLNGELNCTEAMGETCISSMTTLC